MRGYQSVDTNGSRTEQKRYRRLNEHPHFEESVRMNNYNLSGEDIDEHFLRSQGIVRFIDLLDPS